LKRIRKNEIHSVYDLALIVVDECAKVFFDRTKSGDAKPNLMDIYAGSIGRIVRFGTPPDTSLTVKNKQMLTKIRQVKNGLPIVTSGRTFVSYLYYVKRESLI